MPTGVGIDIGTEYIKVVQARVSSGAVTVTGAHKIPRKPDLGVDLPDDGTGSMVLPETLGQELKQAGLGRSGTAGVSGREVLLKYLTPPPMVPAKLKMFIDMEVGGKLTARGGGETLPVTYDHRILNVPTGLRGDLVIMSGLCKNDYLFGVNSALKSAGLTANGITPSCFGLVNTYLRTQKIPEKETVVLVEVGHELLEVAILEENRLYFARSAPGGGKRFTVALDKLLKIGMAKAAEFKHQRAHLLPEGAPLPSKQELQFQAALREGAENIAGAIRSSVMFCRTQARLPKLEYDRVILSGGGARLNGLREYLEKKIGRPVQALDLASSLDLRKLDAASARCFEGEVPDMAVALGLAIIDADPGSFHFSLLPQQLATQRRFWRKTVFGIAAAVVLMLGLIVPAQNSSQAVLAATERAKKFEGYKLEAKQQKADFQKALQENQSLGRKADYYARLTRMGRIYLKLFSVLRAENPKDIMYTYLGPARKEDAGGPGVAGAAWDAVDEPVREFSAIGYYDAEVYPGVKFNEVWEGLRKKLLEVPGVKIVEKENVLDEEKAPRAGSKLFQFKIYLQDDKEPPKVFGAVAVPPGPAAKKGTPPAAGGQIRLAPK